MGCLILVLLSPFRALPRLAMASLGVIALLVFSTTSGLITNIASLANRGTQVQVRVSLASAAWHQFLAHPLFGMGLNNFSVQYGNIVHTTPLWFAAEFGAAGLAVFFGLVVFHGRKVWSGFKALRQTDAAFGLGLLAATSSILGLWLGIEATYQLWLWVLLGVGTAAALRHLDPGDGAASTRLLPADASPD